MEEKVSVVNNRTGSIVLSRPGDSGSLNLELPFGATHVAKAELDRFLNDGAPVNKAFFAEGILQIQPINNVDQDTLPAYGGDLSRLKLKVALRSIAASSDPRQLQGWLKQDGRKEVRDAIIERGVALQTARDADKKPASYGSAGIEE